MKCIASRSSMQMSRKRTARLTVATLTSGRMVTTVRTMQASYRTATSRTPRRMLLPNTR